MQKFISAIPNLYQSTDKKVLHSVVKDLVKDGWVPEYDRLEITREGYKSQTRGGGVKKGTRRKWQKNEIQIKVEVEKENSQANIAQVRTGDSQTMPCFNDTGTGTSILPHYDETVWAMNIRVRSASRSMLEEWSAQVRLGSQRGVDRLNHNVQYSYGLSIDSFNLLMEVYERREARYGYGMSFPDYISRYSLNSMAVITAGKGECIEYTEKQLEVTGYFNVQPAPKIQEVSEGLYEGSLIYTFTLNRPFGLVHYFPLMVHQQVMPWEYMSSDQDNYENVLVYCPIMRGFTNVREASSTVYQDITVPSMDRGWGGKYPPGYHPLVSFMVTIDDEDDKVLFNLRNAEDIELDFGLLNAIQNHWTGRIHIPYATPFLLTLHQDKHLVEQGAVTLDEHLDVVTDRDLYGRSIFRVTLCITIAPHMLADDAFVPIIDNHRLKAIITETINNLAVNRGGFLMNTFLLPNDLDATYYYQTVLPNIHLGYGTGNGFNSFGQDSWGWAAGRGIDNNDPSYSGSHYGNGNGNYGDGWGVDGETVTVSGSGQVLVKQFGNRHSYSRGEPYRPSTNHSNNGFGGYGNNGGDNGDWTTGIGHGGSEGGDSGGFQMWGHGSGNFWHGRTGDGQYQTRDDVDGGNAVYGGGWSDPSWDYESGQSGEGQRYDPELLHRNVYGRAVYGNNPYSNNRGKPYEHVPGDNGEGAVDSRYRYGSSGLVSRFSVMTVGLHAMKKIYMGNHPPMKSMEGDRIVRPLQAPIASTGENDGHC